MAPQAAGDTGRVPELLVEPSFLLPWPPSVPTALLGHPSPLRCRLTAQPSRTQPLLPGAGLPSRERRLQQEPYGAGLQRGGSQMGSLKSARLSPSLTGALGLPRLRVIRVGGRQGQLCRVLETMPNGCPVPPPCGVVGCCPPLLPAMALSGAARGRSRWQRQRGGRGCCGGAS